MARRTAADEALEAEILELARQGGSARSIEAALGGRAKKTRIAEIVSEHRKGTGTRPRGAALVQPAPAPLPTVEELAAGVGEELGAADRAYARLDELHRKLTARVDQEIAAAHPDMRNITDVSKLMMEVAKTLAQTRPPRAVNPDEDPTNLDAASRLLERLDALVAACRVGEPA